LLGDLLQRIDDNIFDNPFTYQHRFDYFEASDNKDDEMLDSNMIVNIDDDINIDDDVGDEIISYAPKFGAASGSTFVVSHDWTLSHRHLLGSFDLEAEQIFNNKNKFINLVKW